MKTYSNGYHFGMVTEKDMSVYVLDGWYIDGTGKCLYYGDIDLADYFDDEGLSYMDDLYEVGVS